jgi:hypothetical protein
MRKEGQSAIEFVIIVGALLFFLASFLIGIQYNISDRVKQQRTVVLQDVAFQVQDELNLASKATDGYSRIFRLPTSIAGADYEINVIDNVVFVRTLDGNDAIALPTINVTGEILIGDNIIRKVDGEILLNS